MSTEERLSWPYAVQLVDYVMKECPGWWLMKVEWWHELAGYRVQFTYGPGQAFVEFNRHISGFEAVEWIRATHPELKPAEEGKP